MNITIIVPTYNESANIAKMIEAISKVAKASPAHTFSLLVVDDTSPDGTADIVSKSQQTYPFVHLLLRKEKTGLGAAYLDGFKYAMSRLNPDILIEMDADFQHDPADLPKFIEAIKGGADLVLGSRYIGGGAIPQEWELYRKILSVWGNRFTKIVLGLYEITDFTTGYRAWRVAGFMNAIDLSTILSKGFAYKIDLLYQVHKLGAKIKEIPIIFGLRTDGESKMHRNNPMETLRVIFTIKFRERESFFKFLLVGTAGFATDFLLFNIFSTIEPLYATSALLSGFFAMLTTLLLNNIWSFRANSMGKKLDAVWKTAFYFISSAVPIFVRNWLVNYSGVTLGHNFFIRNGTFLIGVALGLIWNYLVYSKIIWNRSKGV